MAGQDKKGSSKAPTVTKDKLDLNLSPPYFLTPISNSETREIFAFDTQEDDDSMSISSNQDFTGLDDCIDQSCRTETFSIAHLIRGRQPEIIEWDGAEMPFKDRDTSTKEACYVTDSDPVEDAVHRVKRILDAKCNKADIEKICEEQAELDKQQ